MLAFEPVLPEREDPAGASATCGVFALARAGGAEGDRVSCRRIPTGDDTRERDADAVAGVIGELFSASRPGHCRTR
eukprot:5282659-Pleurochrysis_carterae.AAC.1